jgi:hypothetical protein
MGRLFLLFPILACASGPSVDDLVEQLAGDADEASMGEAGAALAKGRAVEPLLQALEEPAKYGRPPARP